MHREPLFGLAPLFDRTPDGRAFVPTWLAKAGRLARSQGRPQGRRASASPLTARRTLACWRRVGPLCLGLLCAAAPSAAATQDLASSERQILIDDAARRFTIPAAWIAAVMRVESAGDPRAVSPAGAVGLMQVMPSTYGELRARYRLGEDPFHPRDNVMAGAAYLRELYDRFGAPGFLAAYNAGPERYARRLADGRPLPLETRRYLDVLAPIILAAGEGTPPSPPSPASSVFVQLRGGLSPATLSSGMLFVGPGTTP